MGIPRRQLRTTRNPTRRLRQNRRRQHRRTRKPPPTTIPRTKRSHRTPQKSNENTQSNRNNTTPNNTLPLLHIHPITKPTRLRTTKNYQQPMTNEDTQIDPEKLYTEIKVTTAILAVNQLYIFIGLFALWYGTIKNYPIISILGMGLWGVVLYFNYKYITENRNK